MNPIMDLDFGHLLDTQACLYLIDNVRPNPKFRFWGAFLDWDAT